MSECILWSGYIDQAGYGRFGRHGYAGWNLTIKKDGSRRCRTCHNARERARKVMVRG